MDPYSLKKERDREREREREREKEEDDKSKSIDDGQVLLFTHAHGQSI